SAKVRRILHISIKQLGRFRNDYIEANEGFEKYANSSNGLAMKIWLPNLSSDKRKREYILIDNKDDTHNAIEIGRVVKKSRKEIWVDIGTPTSSVNDQKNIRRVRKNLIVGALPKNLIKNGEIIIDEEEMIFRKSKEARANRFQNEERLVGIKTIDSLEIELIRKQIENLEIADELCKKVINNINSREENF
ncbi:1737_t:CDS:2, partial [Dentiscutata heterogama]